MATHLSVLSLLTISPDPSLYQSRAAGGFASALHSTSTVSPSA